MRLCELIASLLLGIAGVAGRPALARPGPAVLAAVAPAVVRIDASDCAANQAETGTGFVWPSSGEVVTALHVVAGCGSVVVDYTGVPGRTARVERVLPSADLALLSVSGAPPVGPLRLSTAVPVGHDVDVYGYALGEATPEERPLYVTAANINEPYLIDAVNSSARTELTTLGSPSLNTEVLRVDGNLLPGHSGAPILDDDGSVIGIGSGGLQRGTVGVGWAIRAQYLLALKVAPVIQNGYVAALPSAGTSLGFATVTARRSGASVQCGELRFVRTRLGLPLTELVSSSDDQQAFELIASTARQPANELAAIKFDVWTETTSGAGIAVPADGLLQPGDEGCTATWTGGTVSLFVKGSTLPDPSDPTWPNDVNRTTSTFEDNWTSEFAPYVYYPYFILDQPFSYVGPRFGPDGLVVNRKTFIGYRPTGGPPYAAFETLLAKGHASIGVVAITRDYTSPSGVSPPSAETYSAWVAAAFAAALSTVPH